ncbi:hypothetical protein MMC10_008979 [Thelotrema lepadinum]|nr:hypothetical protein [Thelotrema lepadinum]
MLLNLGLPADAAASHRHEFSSHHDSEMTSANPGYQTSYLQPLHYLHEKILAFTGAGAPSIPSIEETQSRPATATSSTAEASAHDGESIATKSRRASAPKKKTIYQIAHPVPRHTRRTLRKSRMVLQLRQIEANRRAATPVIEVFTQGRSSSRPGTRSVSKKASPRKSSVKGEGNPERLVFVTCDAYEDLEGADDISEEEGAERRATVASISLSNGNGTNDRTTIAIGDQRWTVSSLPKGGYEFSSEDGNGNSNKARWVPKPVSERRPIIEVHGPLRRPTSDMQFRFALLNPNGRKHPIIGSMDSNAIEVRDQFVIPETPATSPYPSSPPVPDTAESRQQGSYFQDLQSTAGGILATSNETRLLMLVTGVWVAITEGWTHYGSFLGDTAESLASQPSQSPQKFRSNSPRPEFRPENRSETPRSFTSNISQVFAGRRHRQNTVGSVPTINSFVDTATVPNRRNSGLSVEPQPVLYENSIRSTPAVSTEDIPVVDAQQPSQNPPGLGIDIPDNPTRKSLIEEEPASPASSGFHELLGRLHIGSRQELGRGCSFEISQRISHEGEAGSSMPWAKDRQQRKKSGEKGKRARRLLGFRRSKDSD